MRGGIRLIALNAIIFVILVLLIYSVHQQQQKYSKWAHEQNLLEREQQEIEKEKLLAKEFSDSFYQKLADGFNVNILIIGDSIGAGAGSSKADQTWANRLRDALAKDYDVNVHMTNVSMGGNSSYAGYARIVFLDDDINL